MTSGPARAAPWLVAAVSGRMLAASAARGGHRVVVLDCFADRDTRAAALVARAVAAPGAPRFDRRALLRAARELAPPHASAGLVAGSGFEGRTALLGRLAEGRRLAGNRPEVVAAVKDPDRFFPLLDRLGAPYPEVRRAPPPGPDGWLRKRVGGAGGTHIQPATAQPARRGAYFQRREAGRTLSTLFLADGRRACRIGCSEQWVAPQPGLPFLYGGAVGGLTLSPGLQASLDQWLDGLVAATGLVGLNGLDFLLAEERIAVLELNPRPTATLELYDPDWDGGLFDRHLEACAGRLPGALPPPGPARASTVVTAPGAWSPSPAFAFPSCCRDLPMPGTVFQAGEPVCTVFAEGAAPGEAALAVRERAAALRAAIAVDRTLPGAS